jgi:hypothetical protein
MPLKVVGTVMLAVPSPLTMEVVPEPSSVPVWASNTETATPSLTPPSAGVTLMVEEVACEPDPPPPPPQAKSVVVKHAMTRRLYAFIKLNSSKFEE